MPNETEACNRVDDPAKYDSRREDLKEKNDTVRRPIPRIDKGILKRSHKKYTPTRMKNGINKYFEWCEDNDECPSIKGMMIHLKMYKDTFYNYIKYPEFTDLLEHARMIIANWAEMDVYSTKGMAAGKIAYMKNIHGWSDKLETNNFTEQRIITVDEAKVTIEKLAPQLLEFLKNATAVDQMATIEDAEYEEKK